MNKLLESIKSKSIKSISTPKRPINIRFYIIYATTVLKITNGLHGNYFTWYGYLKFTASP